MRHTGSATVYAPVWPHQTILTLFIFFLDRFILVFAFGQSEIWDVNERMNGFSRQHTEKMTMVNVTSKPELNHGVMTNGIDGSATWPHRRKNRSMWLFNKIWTRVYLFVFALFFSSHLRLRRLAINAIECQREWDALYSTYDSSEA